MAMYRHQPYLPAMYRHQPTFPWHTPPPQINPYLSLSVRHPHVIPCFMAPATKPFHFINPFLPKPIIKDWIIDEYDDSLLLMLVYGYLRDLISTFDFKDIMSMIKDFVKQSTANVFMNFANFKPGDIILTSSRNLHILNFQGEFERIYGKYVCNFQFDDWYKIYIVIPLHISKYLYNAVLFFSNVDTNIIIVTNHVDSFIVDNLSGVLNICYNSIEIWLSRTIIGTIAPQRIVITLTNHWNLILEADGLTYWNALDIEDIDDVMCTQSCIFKKYINCRQDIQIPTFCFINKVMKLTWETKLLYEDYIERMQYDIVKMTNQLILNHRLTYQYH